MFLKKMGQFSPRRIDVNFGLNAAIGDVAIPLDDYYEIVEVREVHTVLGTDGGAVTLTIEKLTGTGAFPGTNCFQALSFNLKAAINTVQTLKVSVLTAVSAAQRAAQLFSPGDRLGFNFNGVLTALAGVGVVAVLRPTRPSSAQAR